MEKATRTAFRMAHVEGYTPSPLVKDGLVWPDRHWVNVFPGNATFTSDSFDYINARTTFFTYAYSTSPGMALSMVNVPKDVPVALFWSVTVYDPITASGLQNGQPFPSLNSMDKPAQNADGTFDIYFGPKSPGEGKNWVATVPGKGWFTLFRLYGPKQAFFDKTWKLKTSRRCDKPSPCS
jgi:hypothetical protein